MAEYAYLFADLLTNAVLEELPLVDVSFGRALGDAGSFSASIPIYDDRVRALGWEAATRPNRTIVYITRDDELLSPAYWLRTRRDATDNDGNSVIELGGSELWTYWQHRRIRTTLSFEAVDQAAIVEEIIDELQAVPSGDIGLVVDAPATGVVRDRTYYGYERKEAAEAIKQLSEVIDGFEFAIDVSGDPTNPTKTLAVSYPRRGVSGFETDLLFELPGNILSYSWPEDGTRQANVVDAIGEGEGDDMLIATATDAASLAAGYPLLEATVSFKDIRDLDYLEPHAEAELEASAQVVTIPSVTVLGDADPIVGSFDTGDDARFVILDDRFPEGIDVYARIVGFEVHPEDPDEGVETVTLILGEIEA